MITVTGIANLIECTVCQSDIPGYGSTSDDDMDLAFRHPLDMPVPCYAYTITQGLETVIYGEDFFKGGASRGNALGSIL